MKMEDQCSPRALGYLYQEGGIEELRHALLYTTLELEAAISSAHKEIARKEDELIHLRSLLALTIKQRDEAQANCQRLLFEKIELQQQPQQLEQELPPPLPPEAAHLSGPTSDEDEPRPPTPPQLQQLYKRLVSQRPLPEKGKLLEAVMAAGPLLQTLLLAGQLPLWHHPPPQFNVAEIPPVTALQHQQPAKFADAFMDKE